MLKQELKVHIRWMIRRDMPEVLQMETAAALPTQWNEERFLHALRQRNCIGMVAEAGEKVVGFMIYELHKNKLELLRAVVDSEFRRKGVGRQMIDKLISKLSSHRRTRVCIDVNERLLDAQRFFKAVGMRAVSVLRRADENDDDMFRFVFRMANSTAEEVEDLDEVHLD
jgi:ribosomal-protein-alanine N-acetyltransferase